ncbi:SDR family NAD(P)-dependent oxidoreductase [Marinicella sediminis]|uniref:SDR family NAD(P)-dependent oxidoreductase n=1 Tax=Marinicella sediminis TaxID=1792834 RepID=A0ABV7JK93_9GAMM|nr:SDR family NAD(P)-dependent oxidoreductase [Marinicella sediminis]
MTAITFIAGGSKGLGLAMLQRFQKAGHQVIEFSRSGDGKTHLNCDMSQPDEARQVFKSAFNNAAKDPELRSVNLIINAATLTPFGELAQYATAEMEQHLTINIHSTMTLLHEFMTAFQDRAIGKGLAYMSSGAARRAIPGLGIYSASKAFFERFIDTLATEQQSQSNPVKCLIINPGVMNTDMQAEIRQQHVDDFPMLPWWQELHDKGQLADPVDVAEVCYQLISESGENGGYYTAQEYLNKP